jgi:hypothetical protein
LVFRGFEELWNITNGSPSVAIAMLDGPIDFGHACFLGAHIREISFGEVDRAATSGASSHGTAVAGLLFGARGEEMRGIAPGCSGISIPIWSGGDRPVEPCTQEALGGAIRAAVDLGADIINISGGELVDSAPHPLLEEAVAYCQEHNVLMVAAVGNDGCCCPHLPAAIPSVLAVGAMDADGRPLPFSNWAPVYRDSGLLAPGTALIAPRSGGGYSRVNGTSYATAVVSGAAALLLSLEAELGVEPDPLRVRRILLATASACDEQIEGQCERFLAGRMDLTAAAQEIKRSAARQSAAFQRILQPFQEQNMSTLNPNELSGANAGVNKMDAPAAGVLAAGVEESGVHASGCGCESCGGPPRLAYAIGTLGYDFGSRARLDSFAADMAAAGIHGDPYNVEAMLGFLAKSPYAAADLIWTLNIEGVPIYSIAPWGAFAGRGYETLMDLLAMQYRALVQRVAVPGILAGNDHLLSGAEVPVIHPALRGVFGFNFQILIDEALKGVDKAQKEARRAQFQSFFDRFFYELRNLGVTASERAINFAGTTVFKLGAAFTGKIGANLALYRIEVSKSSVCPVGGDCWDVSMSFFDPRHMLDHAREVFRFTVDVSQDLPVRVGPVNSWFTHSVGL